MNKHRQLRECMLQHYKNYLLKTTKHKYTDLNLFLKCKVHTNKYKLLYLLCTKSRGEMSLIRDEVSYCDT